ncbi:phosphonate metabolism protein/1,5-bisphosphokinase (PRPP-forming) PhnN [Sulfitobacter sp. EhC04]|uniref:phosphonate metabolism protein/1,5-bisphosphokinase (PRPP-forming) PhnN n=1 Tax=Sulfitobacter sp. EhC04 TaxID=1849168 RepID=UPI0007F47832|nr:phosphonate metabolism protein/1,5-bisphosphokinase (PRPP-forming) PhnN [Sulfitobacter sp. EhC04]OAN73519.1 phosphonate metabolism protein/1,5-bisphosphokinase (PRPP-forming) PhnN [Sulfitobacter sp. EhC04]
MSIGRFIAVVGPSGVGKDSVMAGMVAQAPSLVAVRRVITRSADAGGEDFDAVSDAEFARRVAQEAFVLQWQAHGLRYGIPAGVVDEMARGQDVLANLSRSVLPMAQALFERFEVLSLTATPEVLEARLRARQRENAAQIETRLARADFALPAGISATRIDNSGALPDTVARALAALYPVRA